MLSGVSVLLEHQRRDCASHSEYNQTAIQPALNGPIQLERNHPGEAPTDDAPDQRILPVGLDVIRHPKHEDQRSTSQGVVDAVPPLIVDEGGDDTQEGAVGEILVEVVGGAPAVQGTPVVGLLDARVVDGGGDGDGGQGVDFPHPAVASSYVEQDAQREQEEGVRGDYPDVFGLHGGTNKVY